MATQPDIRTELRVRILLVSESADFEEGGGGSAAWENASALADYHDVILAVPEVTPVSHRRFAVVYYNRRNLGLLVRDSDVAIFSRSVLEANPTVLETNHSLYEIVDLMAVPEQSLRRGDLECRPLPSGGVSPLKGLKDNELVALRSGLPEPAGGITHYLDRLRFHLRQGGFRQAAGRGGALAKRKLRGRKRN